MQLPSEAAGRRSQALQCGLDIGIGRVDEKRNNVRGGDQLVEQLQPLRGELHVQGNHAREIASRSAEAGDQTKFDRIGRDEEHDWNRSGCCPCREHRWSARRDDDGHLTTNEFGCHCLQPIILALCPAVFDRHVPALDIARFLQTPTECIHHGPVSIERCGIEKPHHRQRRLLCARRERPRDGRAAEQRDDLAAFPLTESHGLPTSHSPLARYIARVARSVGRAGAPRTADERLDDDKGNNRQDELRTSRCRVREKRGAMPSRWGVCSPVGSCGACDSTQAPSYDQKPFNGTRKYGRQIPPQAVPQHSS
jgi:hypothetical protein